MDSTLKSQRIPTQEKWLYGIAGLGQNIIYIVVGSFLMFFLTDVYGIDPMATGTMMMIARIWDALNDPLMGIVADRTRTRWGKLRPWILWSLAPMGLFTVLLFLGPEFGTPALKLVWCYAAYFFWDIAYTMSDIPYWGLSAAMTTDSRERTKLLTMTRILTMVGMAVAIVGIPLLIGALGGATTPEEAARISHVQNKAAYTSMAVICALAGCALFSLAFFCTKERAEHSEERITLRKSLSTIAVNTPLLLVLLASLLSFGRQMSGAAGLYVSMWNFRSTDYYAILGGVSMLGTILAIAVTPLFLRRMGKKALFIGSALVGAAINVGLYFLGSAMTGGTMVMQRPSDIWLCLACLFAASVSMGFFTILQTTMIADSVDYLEWKTGVRAEALCFSGQTFMTKVVNAICTFVFGIILSTTGYVTAGAASQPHEALVGIFQSATLWPALGCILSAIPIFWYRLDEKSLRRYESEIEARRGAGA